MTESTDLSPWWGAVSLDEQTGGEWQVGPSTLWVFRAQRDWRVVHRSPPDAGTADPMAQRSGVTVPLDEERMHEVLEVDTDDYRTHRFGVRRTDETVALRPALADRPVVMRPEHSLSVLPDEEVTLYVSTPVWVRIELTESERKLTEIASHRMSDTWFGASTQTGELCYATRTAGRLRLDQLPRRFHRAVTPLKIQNQATEPLALERVQLPVPHLATYVTPDDALWTDAGTMTHRTAGAGAHVQVREGAPADAGAADRIQEPRETIRGGLITSTFSAVGALFGP